MLLGLSSALAAAVVFGGASILQATGSRRVAGAESQPTDRGSGLGLGVAVALLRQPTFVGALLLNVLGFLLHLVAVRTVPLFLAQTGIAASLAVTALLAVRIFHDRLSAIEWAAVGAVCAGLVLLTAASGEAGDQRATTGLTLGSYVVVVAMVALGLVAGRAQGPVAAAVLSTLAGLGFATTAVVARLLPTLGWSVLAEPVAYALPMAGALAFLLYSLALQRSSVTLATTPMIVLQTGLPAVAGLAVLGDAVRPGWTAALVAGGALTLVAAAVLVRFESA